MRATKRAAVATVAQRQKWPQQKHNRYAERNIFLSNLNFVDSVLRLCHRSFCGCSDTLNTNYERCCENRRERETKKKCRNFFFCLLLCLYFFLISVCIYLIFSVVLLGRVVCICCDICVFCGLTGAVQPFSMYISFPRKKFDLILLFISVLMVARVHNERKKKYETSKRRREANKYIKQSRRTKPASSHQLTRTKNSENVETKEFLLFAFGSSATALASPLLFCNGNKVSCAALYTDTPSKTIISLCQKKRRVHKGRKDAVFSFEIIL